MIKQPNAFTGVLAVMVAAGCCGGLIARNEKLLGQSPGRKKRSARRIPGSARKSSQNTAAVGSC